MREEPDASTAGSEASPTDQGDVRLPQNALDDLAAAIARLTEDSRSHGQQIDRLASEPTLPALPDAREPGPADGEPMFILAMDGSAYDSELAALTQWVNFLLLPVYGREISTNRPWCHRWPEHPEAVARLHALWLAWQQLTVPAAGPAGPSAWHRDHLGPTWLELRSPDGPFSACTTNSDRPQHRLLASPSEQEVHS